MLKIDPDLFPILNLNPAGGQGTLRTLAALYTPKELMVIFGDCFKTNGKVLQVVILDEDSKPEDLIYNEIGLYHELGHVWYSNFDKVGKHARNLVRTGIVREDLLGMFRAIHNSLEDIRIEYKFGLKGPNIAAKMYQGLHLIADRIIKPRKDAGEEDVLKDLIDMIYINGRNYHFRAQGLEEVDHYASQEAIDIYNTIGIDKYVQDVANTEDEEVVWASAIAIFEAMDKPPAPIKPPPCDMPPPPDDEEQEGKEIILKEGDFIKVKATGGYGRVDVVTIDDNGDPEFEITPLTKEDLIKGLKERG